MWVKSSGSETKTLLHSTTHSCLFNSEGNFSSEFSNGEERVITVAFKATVFHILMVITNNDIEVNSGNSPNQDLRYTTPFPLPYLKSLMLTTQIGRINLQWLQLHYLNSVCLDMSVYIWLIHNPSDYKTKSQTVEIADWESVNCQSMESHNLSKCRCASQGIIRATSIRG